MSVNPKDPGGETGLGQEQPPISNPIPDETRRPDIVAPQHNPDPITHPDVEEPERDRDPESSGDESEDKPARA